MSVTASDPGESTSMRRGLELSFDLLLIIIGIHIWLRGQRRRADLVVPSENDMQDLESMMELDRHRMPSGGSSNGIHETPFVEVVTEKGNWPEYHFH